MPEHYIIKRTGQLPLEFEGEILAEVTGKWHKGQERNRWHDLRVYRTRAGTIVAEVVYRTYWQGEENHYTAEIVGDDPRRVADWFALYRPLDHVAGYPPGEHYADKQRRLEEDLLRRYAARVTELFDTAAFHERID